jgi:hypothetical protein
MNTSTGTKGVRTIERRLAEGRGQGRGAQYRPWLEIHDVPSRGLVSRLKSPLNGRVYHPLSKLETDWLFALHAVPGVIDIREGFPLGLEETLEIATQLGIAHPTDPKSKAPCVATTDFVVNVVEGVREIESAFAVKLSADLASQRTLEKLEIERLYWSARSICWRILTEKERPIGLIKNLRWVFPHIDLISSGAVSAAEVHRIRSTMEPMIQQSTKGLTDLTAHCDDLLGLRPGSALSVVRHLIGVGAWPDYG